MITSLIPLIRANEKKLAWVLLTCILVTYGKELYFELDDVEPYPDYDMYLTPYYKWCSLDKFTAMGEENDSLYRNPLKPWFNCFSHNVLGNDRILPAIFSLGIVYFTYLLGHYITKDRIIGLLSAVAMSHNPLLILFDTSPTYDQGWAFFLLGAVVLLYKFPLVSPISLVLSILSKIYAISFLPAYIFTIYKTDMNRKILIMIITVIVITPLVYFITQVGIGNTTGFFPERTTESFLRIFEVLWPVFPLFIFVFGIDLVIKKHTNESRDIPRVWILWIMMTIPIVYLFSQQFMFGYRFVPLGAFLSVYTGIVIVKLLNNLNDWILNRK